MKNVNKIQLRTKLHDKIIELLEHHNYCEHFDFEPDDITLENLLESIKYNSGYYYPKDFKEELTELFHSVDLSEELKEYGLNTNLFKAMNDLSEEQLATTDIDEMPMLIEVILNNIDFPEYLCWYRDTAISKEDWCIDNEFRIYATMRVWLEVVTILTKSSQQ